MSKENCTHSVGYTPYSGDMLMEGECFDDPVNVSFNYCPWCGKKVNPIEKEEDDCKKGGCAD